MMKTEKRLCAVSKGLTEETANEIVRFRDERNWKQFHTPKDLALSLCLEAAELLEIFQWSGTDLYCEEKKERIKEELADVVHYCVLMADICDIDLDSASREKLQRNREKYPVEKAYGVKLEDNTALLEGVVSRKKQVVPIMTENA